VDLFGDEDPVEQRVSCIGRVQPDETAAEQGDDDGDPPTRAPREAA
jgi:hypothetical protein